MWFEAEQYISALTLILDHTSNTDQTKDSDISSLNWEEYRKGKGKGKGRGRRRGKGKGEEKETETPTEADQTYQEKEIDAVKTLVTLSKTISNMPTAPYDNKKEPNQLTTDKTAHETSDHRNKLPIEIWIKIWEIVANDNPRNLDIWTWSEGPKTLWENEKKRIIYGPQDYSTRVRWNPFKFITTQIVPPILHVSCLSRYIGLKYYKLGFGCHFGMSKIPSESHSILEPRIYCHRNDLVCPMGRFNFIESECFWNQFPEEISAIAFNVGKLNNVDPKPHKDNEDYKNQISHEHFSYEYSRGLVQDPDKLVGMNFFSESCQGAKFSKRAAKLYLDSFSDYISKQGPRDFRFTPFIDDSKRRGLDIDTDAHFSFDSLLGHAAFTNRVNEDGPDDWYSLWGEWLQDGGLTWLKDGGPKPIGIQYDNPTVYDLDRYDYYVAPWMEEEFINRGVPNIGTNSEFWVPGVPEVRYMKLEIHG
ncbi:hypothetical protein BELL_0244g00070 [Botrytis elliptica]|uniref:2EXR domain-containing protein n=1 Tax=Botrytis elliptica TaxID=278938 RepID=A0A4Z1JUS7_9HELO|nr:hypothetical protein EAE99_006686 [Botrytis elliptica]TGO74962.1 hypothetical protein BELL_0244g00070 [Botrytis elliptica]